MDFPFLDKLAARRRFGMRPGLQTTKALLEKIGNPQDALRFVHIAGTNGKGAVSAMISSILASAGYKTGRYTSPHLVSLNERFQINSNPADEITLASAAEDVFHAVEELEKETNYEVTFFECLTAVAFLLFKRENADIVVLETGLGGRLDATNVIKDPLLSVITRIGIDHDEWLGSTHAAIASEKAGIIKPGRPVVCGEMPEAAREVIARAASLNGSDFVFAPECISAEILESSLAGQTLKFTTAARNLAPVKLPLGGSFQAENAVTALAAVDTLQKAAGLRIPDRAVIEGFSSVVWPGRFQLVCDNPPVLVDGAHNPDGARALRDSLRYANIQRPVGLVAGFCGDKDVLANLRIMSAVSSCGWATPIDNPRSLPPDETAERMIMSGFLEAKSCATLKDALDQAMAWAKACSGIVVVCGSLFLAGEALVELGALKRGPVREPNEKLAPDA